MIKLGWIGVGNMGLPMALNLLKVGHELHVYNRSAEKTEPLTGKGAHLEETAEALAESADIIFVMLSDDEVVKTVFLTDGGMLKANLKGKLIINMSTVAPKTSRQLAELVVFLRRLFREVLSLQRMAVSSFCVEGRLTTTGRHSLTLKILGS